MTKVRINIADILEAELGSQTHIPATVDIAEMLEFNDFYECEQDLDDLLDEQKMVGVVWTIDDVQKRRPDVTADQAWEILKTAKERYIAEESHFDFLESMAESIYPKGREARPAKFAQVIAEYNPRGDQRESLIDLLTDAMHWCVVLGEPFDRFCGMAHIHFAEEIEASKTEV